MGAMEQWIGRSLRRREDGALLTGRGRYVADFAPPGLLHVAFRRAGLPTGSGLRVDLAPALSMPGVVGAWTAGELGLADEHSTAALPQPPPVRRPVLALDRVRFEGEAVAMVAAETEYQAADAAEAIQVDLDPVADEPAAVDSVHAFGDAAAAF